MKVVVNRCWGGFSLSDVAVEMCIQSGLPGTSSHGHENLDTLEFRSHPIVVEVVEFLGDEANGSHAELDIVEIPFDNTEGWYIHDYDGMETIREKHRSW